MFSAAESVTLCGKLLGANNLMAFLNPNLLNPFCSN